MTSPLNNAKLTYKVLASAATVLPSLPAEMPTSELKKSKRKLGEYECYCEHSETRYLLLFVQECVTIRDAGSSVDLESTINGSCVAAAKKSES